MRDGEHTFVPTPFSYGPWGPNAVHGGPPAGLLAYAILEHVADPEMQLTRLTVDLTRSVPQKPLTTTVETIRQGRRLVSVLARLLADGQEVSRASALLLRRSDAVVGEDVYPPPPGPEGYEITQGVSRRSGRTIATQDRERHPAHRGFHTTVESRWLTGPVDPAPKLWVRIPMPFIEGEETHPAVQAAALSDFGNAVASHVGSARHIRGLSYINADITMVMHRDPVGEWLCLHADHRDEFAGVGLVESIWYDTGGRFARVVESRLANPRG